MKKLFKVYIDTCLIVEAPEDADFYEIGFAARQAIFDHLADSDDISFVELKSIDELPPPWDADCLPYSTEYNPEDRTIGQILGEK